MEQPDPFFEADHGDTTPLVEVPEPLRRSSRRTKRRSSGHHVADPNKIWESVPVREDNQAAPIPSHPSDLNREPDSGPKERRRSVREQMSPDASPTGLKRRGARTQRKPPPPEHSISHARSPQTTELPLRPISHNESRPQRSCPPTGSHRLETIASVENVQGERRASGVRGPTSHRATRIETQAHHSRGPYVSSYRCPCTGRVLALNGGLRPRLRSLQLTSLQALVAEEEKYSRELKTLVDGVIPVLLQCVLSKSDSIACRWPLQHFHQ